MELNRVRETANALLKETKLFWKDWRVEFDNAKTYFGSYDHRRKVILLSRYLMLEAVEDDVRKVVLHQIAHAIAGYQTTNHGASWQSIAHQLGADRRASVNGIRMCKIRPPERAPADSPVARQFLKVFGDATAVLDSSQLREMTTFRFADYNAPAPGTLTAFLELKLWREINDNKMMRLFFLSDKGKKISLDIWQSSFNSERKPADKGLDLKKAEVGRWYELLTTRGDKGFIKLQSMKKVK